MGKELDREFFFFMRYDGAANEFGQKFCNCKVQRCALICGCRVNFQRHFACVNINDVLQFTVEINSASAEKSTVLKNSYIEL